MFRDVMDFLLGNGDVLRIRRILQQTTQAADEVITGSQAANIQGVVQTIALTVLILFFFVDIYEHVQDENFTAESVVRSFVKLLISFILVKSVFQLFHEAILLSNTLLDKVFVVSSGYSNIAPGLGAVREYFNSKSNVNVEFFLPIILRLLIPYMILWVSRAIIYGITAMRAIELVARAVLAPFAVANTFGDGGYIGGLRYLKKYFAVMLQAIAIIVIVWGSGFVIRTEKSNNESVGNVLEIMNDVDGAESMLVDKISGIQALATSLDSSKYGLFGLIVPVMNDLSNILAGKDESVLKQDVAKSAVGEYIFTNVMDEDTRSFGFMTFLCSVQAAATMLCIRSQRLVNDVLGV